MGNERAIAGRSPGGSGESTTVGVSGRQATGPGFPEEAAPVQSRKSREFAGGRTAALGK